MIQDAFDAYDDELDLKEAYEKEKYEERLAAGIWQTRDGRCIPIRKMDSSHLLNTINLLVREVPDSEYIKLMQEEINKRWG